MPLPGKKWRHVIINTKNSWLPGDARGFRDRGHRVHSSGDYKNPPPTGEHSGLLKYAQKRSATCVRIHRTLRPLVGATIVQTLQESGHRLLCVAVSGTHAHLLAELPDQMGVIKQIIGRAKRGSSRAIRKSMPGAVWSARGAYKPVEDRAHLKKVFRYILFKQGSDAWTWSFRDASDAGRFGRSN